MTVERNDHGMKRLVVAHNVSFDQAPGTSFSRGLYCSCPMDNSIKFDRT